MASLNHHRLMAAIALMNPTVTTPINVGTIGHVDFGKRTLNNAIFGNEIDYVSNYVPKPNTAKARRKARKAQRQARKKNRKQS